jgi:hypothetical protein
MSGSWEEYLLEEFRINNIRNLYKAMLIENGQVLRMEEKECNNFVIYVKIPKTPTNLLEEIRIFYLSPGF